MSIERCWPPLHPFLVVPKLWRLAGVAVKLEEEVKCEEPAPKKRAVMAKHLAVAIPAVWGYEQIQQWGGTRG